MQDSMSLTEKIIRKSRESVLVQEKFFRENAERISECAIQMSEAFARGAQLFIIGNGGSACDAQHASVEFMHPVIEKRRALKAMALTTDTALLTAVSNDSDFSQVFAEQIRTLARPGDMLLAITTSGKSASVIRGLKIAREMGMLTIGFSGRDGGKLVDLCNHSFVVPSFSIHRIQESHLALLHILWDLIHVVRGEEDII